MWEFLTYNANSEGVASGSFYYDYNAHDMTAVQQALIGTFTLALRDATAELELIHAFLRFVESHRDEAMLAACLAATADDEEPDSDSDPSSLLAMFAAELSCSDDSQLLSDVFHDFARWSAQYPAVATLVDKESSQCDAVRTVLKDGVATVPDSLVEAAQHINETSGHALVNKDRHCAYPGCAVTGAEDETGAEDGRTTWKCARCRAVYYCSKEHQSEHWVVHKALCKRVGVS
jgi:hypothetical protein